VALNRDLLITLVFAGGSADLAYLSNPSYSLKDYENAIPTQEYKDFAKQLSEDFIDNADQRLLGNLYKCQEALQTVGAEHKNYPQILKAYIEILKLTGPIVERLSKHAIETNTFSGLKLVINGAENKGE